MIAPAAARPLARVAFALWVSICSAAPEFIWQGLLRLGGHFTLFNLYSVILIGLVLAFFVEPLLQRIRRRRWDVDEHDGQGVLSSVVLALAFGVAAVALHECMNTYVGGSEHLQSQRQEGLGRAVDLILQWALVPFGVTLAWFGARRGRRFGWYAAALAFLWAVAVGLYYEWDWRDIVISAVSGGLIAVLGALRIAHGWNRDTFRKLAFGIGLLVLGFASVGLLVQASLSLAGVTSWRVYSSSELFVDLRFYFGWVLGLLIAPNPVPEELSGRDAPSCGGG